VDNIPGIPGVGEKTAAKLLKQYDNLENILAHGDQIKGALGEKIRLGGDLARLSKKLATIITETPIPFHEENFRIKTPDTEALREVFAELEFRTLGRRILGEALEGSQGTPDLFSQTETAPPSLFPDQGLGPKGMENIHSKKPNYRSVSPDEIPELLEQLSKYKELAFDTETTGLDPNLAEILGIGFH